MTKQLTQAFTNIITSTGEDIDREGLQKTPERAAKAFQFLTSGYTQNIENVINDAIYSTKSEQMIIVRDIEFYSLCEHHLLPFTGKCHIAYIPDGKVLGLSKFARLVEVFARRLQIQEELTQQIADTIKKTLNPLGIGVVIESQHFCMLMRGVEKQHASMTTTVMLDSFKQNSTHRHEFLNLIK